MRDAGHDRAEAGRKMSMSWRSRACTCNYITMPQHKRSAILFPIGYHRLGPQTAFLRGYASSVRS